MHAQPQRNTTGQIKRKFFARKIKILCPKIEIHAQPQTNTIGQIKGKLVAQKINKKILLVQ